MNYESLLSYIVGFGSALVLFLFQDWWRRRDQKKKLAKVLEMEIQDIKNSLPDTLDSTKKILEHAENLRGVWGVFLMYQKFDTHTYENLLKDLGVFKKETIEALRTFYSNLYPAEYWIRENQNVHRQTKALVGEKKKRFRELSKDFVRNYLKSLKKALGNADSALIYLKKEYN